MSTSISPQRITAAMSAAMQAISTLPANEDTALLRDTIEGQSNVFEIIDALAEKAIADKLLAEKAIERARRIAAREEGHRKVIANMMEALGLAKLERPLATLSLSTGPRTAVVTDQAALPTVFFKRSVDKAELLKALKAGPVVGAELSNGSQILRITTQ